MKKRDLYRFMEGLNMAKFEHPRVTYAVNKNKRQVEEIVKDMEKAKEIEEDMKEFVSKREELAKKHSAKDSKGNPKFISEVIFGRQQMVYDIPKKEDTGSKFRLELAELEEEYSEAIKKQTEKERKYEEEFLDDDTEFVPHMVELKLLEQNEKCPQAVMDRIYWMIKEEEEQKNKPK